MSNESEKSADAAGLGKLIVQYFPGQILPGMATFVAIPFLTRMLSKDQYGYYVLILAMTTTVSTLGFSWVGNCALRFYRLLESDLPKLFLHLFWSIALTAAVFTGLTAVIWFWLPERYRGMLLLSAPLIVLLGVTTILLNVLRAQSKAVAFSAFKVLGSLMRFLPGIVALVWIGYEVKWFVVGWTGGALVLIIFLIRVTGVGQGLFTGRVDKKLFGQFMAYGLPIMTVSLMSIIVSTIDRYIIDVFRTRIEVAIYGVSFQLGSMSVLLMARAIMMAVFPRAIDTYEGGRGYAEVATRGLRYFLLASVPVLAIVGAVAPKILEIYAGPGYGSGGNVLRLVMVAIFIMSLAQYYRMPFLVNRRTGMLILIGIVPAILSVVFNFILVPMYGSLGSAVTLLISYSSMLLMSIYYGRQIVQIKWPKVTMLHCAIGVICVFVAIFITMKFMRLDSLPVFVLSIVVWVFVYLVALYVLGEIKGEVRYVCRYFLR